MRSAVSGSEAVKRSRRGPPTPGRARRQYGRAATSYDRRLATRIVAPVQRRAIERLELRPGQTVLDVACGTGLNFAGIEAAIGTEGRLIGVDLTADMLAVARRRIESHGWSNVELIESPVEAAAIPVPVDAALLSFTHDVLRSPAAVARVTEALAPGGRVVACGSKWAPWWAVPVNAVLAFTSLPYTTTFEGFRQPWSLLERSLFDREVESLALGSMYVFSGARQ